MGNTGSNRAAVRGDLNRIKDTTVYANALFDIDNN